MRCGELPQVRVIEVTSFLEQDKVRRSTRGVGVRRAALSPRTAGRAGQPLLTSQSGRV